jgi:hypothetical protein
VFQEELDKKFPEHQFNKAEVKKYLEECAGDLIPAGQLLFEQSTLYGIKSKKSGTQNPKVMQILEMHILQSISQDIMKNGTEAQTERQAKKIRQGIPSHRARYI